MIATAFQFHTNRADRGISRSNYAVHWTPTGTPLPLSNFSINFVAIASSCSGIDVCYPFIDVLTRMNQKAQALTIHREVNTLVDENHDQKARIGNAFFYYTPRKTGVIRHFAIGREGYHVRYSTSSAIEIIFVCKGLHYF